MIRTYSTESITQQLQSLQIPYADLIARALTALITGRKATIHQISCLLPGEQTAEAKRQLIRRFLDQPSLTPERWAKVIAPLLPTPDKWVLSLDRTNWMVGEAPINLLVLAVVCSGCAVPLLWLVLDKGGASNTRERIALLRRFLDLFGRQSLRFITADREFIGNEKIPFRIRIKAGEFLAHSDGEERHAEKWFSNRACVCKPKKMWLWGLLVFVGGKRLARNREEYLIVISNEVSDLLEDYRLRWKIETLFQALKGRGFNLECSRMTQGNRVSVWFGFLSLALTWCLRVGEFLDRELPLKLKKHGRRSQSVFHRGVCALQAILSPLSGRRSETLFYQFVRLLSLPGET